MKPPSIFLGASGLLAGLLAVTAWSAWTPSRARAATPVPSRAMAALNDDWRDSILVVSALEHALIMQNPTSGEREAFFRVGLSPTDVAVSPDGLTAVVSNRGMRISGTTISVVDLYATKLVRTIPLVATSKRSGPGARPGREETRGYHRPTGITFIGDKPRVLVSCAIEGALLLVDLIEARVIGDVVLDADDAQNVLVDHSGEFAYVANQGSGTVSVVKLDRMQVVGSIDVGGGPRGMALHPTRDEIWVTNTQTNSISIIDLETRDEQMEFACGAMPSDIVFTPDGAHALVANMQEGNVSVFDTDTRRIRTLIELDRVSHAQAKLRPVEMPGHFGRSPLPTRILINPEGTHAWISTRRDDQLHEVDLSTWQVVRKTGAPTAPTCLAWSRVPRDVDAPAIVPLGGSRGRATSDDAR